MKNLKLRLICISSIILFASQISAQENNPSSSDGDGNKDPDSCSPFPFCVHDSSMTTDENDEESGWYLLWEKLTKDVKETVDSLTLPTQPE
jgi:hypothetical protein